MKTWQKAVLLGLSLCQGLLPAQALGASTPETQSLSISRSLAPVILVHPKEAPLPQQERSQLLDHALYLSIAVYRRFDYLSTRHALANGARDAILPQWVVEHRETFHAFEGIATATEVESSVWLITTIIAASRAPSISSALGRRGHRATQLRPGKTVIRAEASIAIKRRYIGTG
jgi:hypothetical protein